MSNQGAFVTRIAIRDHPNADKLALGQVGGAQIVVGKDTPDGELGLFFSTELRISDEYGKANNLFPITDEGGKKIGGGFFPPNGRVRAQSFRGQRSEGYFASLNSLAFTGGDTSKLKEGDLIDEFNGVKICEKYVTAATAKAGSNKQQAKSIPTFAKHVDTEQLGYYADKIPAGSLLTMTYKLHGTSARTGYVQVKEQTKRPPLGSWVAKIFNHIPKLQAQYGLVHRHVTGTRNTVLGTNPQGGFYGTEQFRITAAESFQHLLHEGEVVYYELVGYTEDDRPLMGEHNFSKFNDKNISKWGDNVVYNYGQCYGTCGIYVYRITRVTKDTLGQPVVTELSWPQVKGRCGELKLKYVPETHMPVTYSGEYNSEWVTEWADKVVNDNEPDPLSNGAHPKEGVVLRVDTPDGDTYFLKHKSYVFKVGEGIAKEKDTYIDTEESA